MVPGYPLQLTRRVRPEEVRQSISDVLVGLWTERCIGRIARPRNEPQQRWTPPSIQKLTVNLMPRDGYLGRSPIFVRNSRTSALWTRYTSAMSQMRSQILRLHARVASLRVVLNSFGASPLSKSRQHLIALTMLCRGYHLIPLKHYSPFPPLNFHTRT